jgi:hypothetical protein
MKSGFLFVDKWHESVDKPVFLGRRDRSFGLLPQKTAVIYKTGVLDAVF